VRKLSKLEQIILEFLDRDESVSFASWDKLWKIIGEKFGTKEASVIYNLACNYYDFDDPESEQEFIETYMRN
jgi:hypothetical protein